MPGDPEIVLPIKAKKPKAESKPSAFVIENPGEAGAKIFDSIVKKLRESGHNMMLVRAKMRIETRALVVDERIFKDDEEHEALLIFDGELEREA